MFKKEVHSPIRLRQFSFVHLVLSSILIWISAGFAEAQQPEVFFYIHKDTARQGCFYKPEGKGPFPAMIYNQATPKPSIELGEAVPFRTLAKFYVSQGYILFLPGRPLLKEVTSTESDEKKKAPLPMSDEELMRIFDGQSENIAGALEWIKAQAIVDLDRIYMSGHSAGGIQTLLLADKALGIRGYVAFSPGAKLWEQHPTLRKALEKAVTNQKAPIFLIQPQNDLGFGPSIVLGPQLAKAPMLNRARIFPPYGKSPAEGNSFAFNAPEIWGKDVIDFINLCRTSSAN